MISVHISGMMIIFFTKICANTFGIVRNTLYEDVRSTFATSLLSDFCYVWLFGVAGSRSFQCYENSASKVSLFRFGLQSRSNTLRFKRVAAVIYTYILSMGIPLAANALTQRKR